MDQPAVNPTPTSAPNPLDSFYAPPSTPASPSPTPQPPTTPPSYSAPPSYSPPLPPEEVKVVSQAKKGGSGASGKVVLAGLSVLLLAGTAFGVTQFTGLFSKAAGEACTPENIQETNLTANSVEIIFQTDKTCQTEVAYGTSNQPEALLLQVPEAMASLNHRIRLSPLLPSTTYYYQIKADGKAVGTVRNFLTLRADGGTASTISPTAVPTQTAASGTYKFEDFEPHFGTGNETFDIDENGIVNYADWSAYQKK